MSKFSYSGEKMSSYRFLTANNVLGITKKKKKRKKESQDSLVLTEKLHAICDILNSLAIEKYS